MRRREFLKKAGAGAAAFGAFHAFPGCKKPPVTGVGTPFGALREKYFLRTLQLNPVLSTYLGGDGYDRSLRPMNGKLRDFRPDSLAGEVSWLKTIRTELAAITPATLAIGERIDHGVIGSQISFLLHQ